MHNFGVLAQVLLTGESRFLRLCDFKELGVAKQSRSTTSARSALRHPWSIIARTNFLKAATNLNFVQPKLFQASRQHDHRFSDCTVSVIQILDEADVVFRISGGIADRSIRDHHVRRQAAQPLTILPPVAALAVGLPAQRAIAQRFRAVALIRHQRVADERPLLGKANVMFNLGRLGLNGARAVAVRPEPRPSRFAGGLNCITARGRRRSAGDSENEVGGRA